MHLMKTSPRRSSSSNDSNPSSPSIRNRVKSEELDIWEHAALLYHGYDWSNAAEAFRQLSIQIDDVEAATLCALNAALIQASLGEFELAAVIVEQAARMDQDLIITPYIMGIIDWELAQFIKAEACLDVCLRALNGGDISFADLGLDFVLCSRNVRRQLNALRLDASGRFGPPTAIGPVVPAECIFEPPSRSRSRSWYRAIPHMSLESTRNPPTQSYQAEQDRNSSGVRDRMQPAEYGTTAGRPHTPPPRSLLVRSLRRPSPLRIIKKPLVSKPTGKAYPSSLGTVTSHPVLPSISPTPTSDTWPRLTSNCSGGPIHKRPPCTARDAHGEYGSVRELASFIRRAQDGKTAAIAALQPRDATTNTPSTKELAKFLKHAGKSRPLIPPADLDLFHDDEDEDDTVALQTVTPAANGHGSGSTRRGPVARVENDRSENALRSSLPSTLASPSSEQASSQAGSPLQLRSPPFSSRVLRKLDTRSPLTQITTGDYFNALPSAIYQPLPPTTYRPPSPTRYQLLPQTTYHPPPPTKNKEKIPPPSEPPRPTSPPYPPTPPQRKYPPPWNIHTAASSTSSLYADSMQTIERQEVARDAALRMLEGRERPTKQKAGVGHKASRVARMSNKWRQHGRIGDRIADVVGVRVGAGTGGLRVPEEATKLDSFAILGLGGVMETGTHSRQGMVGGGEGRLPRNAKKKKPRKKWDWRAR
ncbi:hypothetical protein Tdes44962_MAKER02897 [Teratosphaeria destructans]|uniref:Uncharacterized protein n=1 Tax=Teratosphaeria destructans TaxID=418781 RepID=A0A9W7SRN2_9PEZI|nr:hypothetical protein Tdes44962_MAKER02897 [Teratosphaeria destructans]